MRRKLFWWGLVIAWCLFIFYMSQKNASVSAEQSSRVVAALNALLGVLLGEDRMGVSSWIVRKTAHFSEYFILGMLLFQAFRSEHQPKPAIWPIFAWGTFYAVTDEIHQLFVSGRAMRWYDVVIDAAGVLAGALLFTAARVWRRE